VFRFHHNGLTVSELDRSLRFWRDALGLRLEARQERQGGYVETITGEPGAHMLQAHLRAPGSDLRVELVQYLAPKGRHLKGRPRDAGHAHVAILCDDPERLLELLVSAGGAALGRLVTIDAGVNAGLTAVYVSDPDGHVIELMRPRP
jgi:catechol 2,3-dioxygenase-like lactoylglutathione lyase family enzyme